MDSPSAQLKEGTKLRILMQLRSLDTIACFHTYTKLIVQEQPGIMVSIVEVIRAKNSLLSLYNCFRSRPDVLHIGKKREDYGTPEDLQSYADSTYRSYRILT